MSDTEIKQLAAQIARRLFTCGTGKIADRLVLFHEPDRQLQYDIGGWSERAASDFIAQQLESFFRLRSGGKDGG